MKMHINLDFRWWAPIPKSIQVPYDKGMKALTEASKQ